jgi:hypothetical protein
LFSILAAKSENLIETRIIGKHSKGVAPGFRRGGWGDSVEQPTIVARGMTVAGDPLFACGLPDFADER